MTDPVVHLPGFNTESLSYTGLRFAAGPEQGRDLYEIWNAVFDRKGGREGRPDQALPQSGEAREPAAADSAGAGAGSGDAPRAARSPQPSGHPMAQPGSRLVTENSTLTVQSASARAAVAADPAVVAPSMVFAPNIGSDNPVADVAAVAAAPLTGGTSAQPADAARSVISAGDTRSVDSTGAAEESIRVIVSNSTVSIVVRDDTLAPSEAIHCAFATAQQLTGRRDTLARLILNGHTLYQQEPDAGARSSLTLLFAC